MGFLLVMSTRLYYGIAILSFCQDFTEEKTMLEAMHLFMATIQPYMKAGCIIFSMWCITMYIVWELHNGWKNAHKR